MERDVPFLADTSGPFKQLLAAEQTAQSVQAWIQEKKDAIRSIKKQAIDQDTPHNAIYGHIKQLEEDISRLKQLLKSNEASLIYWRGLHIAAGRATVRPLKLVEIPNEILKKIFANFEDDPVPQIQVENSPFDASLPSPDIKSIKNTRRTCRALCEVGSEFLLPIVDISFTRFSLQRLAEISSHPTISKSVRIIRFDISPYNSYLADSQHFREVAYSRLALLRRYHATRAVKSRNEVAEASRISGIHAEMSDLDTAQDEQTLAILKALRVQALLQDIQDVVPLDSLERKIKLATSRAHEEYMRRYLEQRSLIESHQVYADIASSIRRMPSAKKLFVNDTCGRYWYDAFRSGWGRKFDTEKYSSMVMGPSPFHELMVQPGTCEEGILENDKEPPLSLLHRLPSMFQAISQTLTHLDIDIKTNPKIHIDISMADIQSLRDACQKLKSLKLRFAKGYPAVASQGMSPECFTMINSLLGAMLGSPHLEELGLSLILGPAYEVSGSATILGHVLENLSGNMLRSVWLSHIPIKISEFRQLWEKAPGAIHLEMNCIYLLNGTWAQALDILRGSTDSTSRIANPQGGEMRTMSGREARYFRHEFRSEHRDGWCSNQRCPGPASFYIRGGNIPNPLIWNSD